VPDRIVTNDELSATLDTSDEWIFERTGIRERRVGGSASSLGATAARRAIADAGIDADSLDFVLLATTTPDRLIPATAPTIAAELGLNTRRSISTAPAVASCTPCASRPVSPRVAHSASWSSGPRTSLAGRTGDDRTMAVLLGDGAEAVVVEATPERGDLLGFDLGSDGTLTHLLTCEHGGTIWMDGKEIFRRAVRVMVDSSQRALAHAGLAMSDISLVVPHQANVRIINAACQRLGIDESRAVVVLDRFGNTSSASIPLAIDAARSQGRLNDGDFLLLTGFGAGMTWASAVVQWWP
jgi:3-oxoacyl-[acyl-carrier-protein] synthase-3